MHCSGSSACRRPIAQAVPAELESAALDQLARLFGAEARRPEALLVKDWARDPLTATNLDQEPPGQHTVCDMGTFTEPGWGSRLIWSGSETAAGHVGGYLEGALAASERTLASL